MTDTSHQMHQDRANLPERVELARRPAMRDGRALDTESIILVYLPHNRPTPFVTWTESTKDKATYWGHYFGTLRAALEDYETR